MPPTDEFRLLGRIVGAVGTQVGGWRVPAGTRVYRRYNIARTREEMKRLGTPDLTTMRRVRTEFVLPRDAKIAGDWVYWTSWHRDFAAKRSDLLPPEEHQLR